MLHDHRRALWYALLLLASLAFVALAVGRHPAAAAPQTSLAFVGRFDQHMYETVDHIRITPLTWLFRFLNVVGGGVVTIPLRAIASISLLARRWWRRAGGFILTWAASELVLTFLKAWFHRGRPPAGIVATVGFSFPSGHATAGAATAVAGAVAVDRPAVPHVDAGVVGVGVEVERQAERLRFARHVAIGEDLAIEVDHRRAGKNPFTGGDFSRRCPVRQAECR